MHEKAKSKRDEIADLIDKHIDKYAYIDCVPEHDDSGWIEIDRDKLLNLADAIIPIVKRDTKVSFGSKAIIGDVQARFDEVKEEHGFDWDSFYEAWIVGRMELAQECDRHIRDLKTQLHVMIRHLKTKELTDQQRKQIETTESYMKRHFSASDVLR